MTPEPPPVGAGARRFARFAHPPNALGHCGTEAESGIWGYASGLVAPDRGLDELARTFDGAWPYLELLAGTAGVDDPLDDDVVRAYWLGGPLLDRVRTLDWGWHVHDRFAARAGGGPEARRALDGAVTGGRPTHAFHVLCVYPWVGLLRSGVVDGPLEVIEQCRIGWGRVEAVVAGRAVVHGPALTWVDGRLELGPDVRREAQLAVDGAGLVDTVVPGDLVATHWGWVCERLDRPTLRRLEAETRHHLAVADRQGMAAVG